MKTPATIPPENTKTTPEVAAQQALAATNVSPAPASRPPMMS